MKKCDRICATKAPGEENRLRILRLLMKRSRRVSKITEVLTITQCNTSKHLRVLREAALVEVSKRVYALAEDFRSHLTENANVLDLGCCKFYFDKLPR